ncbi:MAG: precorrin-6A/cobalt-precorrin-6A reductase, partial [Propylenella sp.]
MARLLILGGTAEAAELAARLAGDDRLETVTSLAGLTRLPNVGAGAVRRGGFGGPDGLAAFLKDERYDALIDATHPFAARIAASALEAAAAADVPRVKLLRPPFARTADDRFVPVADMKAAAAALPEGARVFLAAGRREIAPFAARKDLWCLVRMIEPPAADEKLPAGEVILGRP